MIKITTMKLIGNALRILPIFIIFATHIATAAIDTCPPKELLYPCICEDQFLPNIKCSNITSMDTLISVFERSGDRRFKFFALDHSSLMYLPASSLVSKRFIYILLEDVMLTSLFDQVPPATSSLETLFLRNVFLQRGIRWDLFKNLSKLNFLQFRNTEVKSLGKSFMENIGDKKIEMLQLTETKTSQLHDQVFANLTELQDLQIMRSNIKILKRSMFPKPAALRSFMFPENEIEILPEDIFSDMPFLKDVSLADNKITKFTESTFKGIFNWLLWFDIERNPINCDCTIEWFVIRVIKNPKRVSGTCEKPLDKKGRHIIDIVKADMDYCHQSPPDRDNSLENVFNT